MYINSIRLENFRNFVRGDLDFIHPDMSAAPNGTHPGAYKHINNVNLVLGINGSGKTTLLKAIALNILAPVISSSGYSPYHLISKFSPVSRRTSDDSFAGNLGEAFLNGKIHLHEQDVTSDNKTLLKVIDEPVSNILRIIKKGDLEEIHVAGSDEHAGKNSPWSQMYENESPAFFMVGYGATRRVERLENIDMGSRLRRSLRYLRVQGLFEDSYSLIPLGNWLPKLEGTAPDRYKEIVALLKQLIPAPISFDGHYEDGEYYFQQSNIRVPFSALSDGYRSYIGW
ncbi:MAG: AAA family ATPase, partial [bacterium]|nr:AAA family ATPase [bacterium]